MLGSCEFMLWFAVAFFLPRVATKTFPPTPRSCAAMIVGQGAQLNPHNHAASSGYVQVPVIGVFDIFHSSTMVRNGQVNSIRVDGPLLFREFLAEFLEISASGEHTCATKRAFIFLGAKGERG